MPPALTITGCGPGGALGGITKLICVTPTRPGGMPANEISAATPATVTVTGPRGRGSAASGVSENGEAPVASDGKTVPSPVINNGSVSPGLPLDDGTSAPAEVNIPGAKGATWNVYAAA